MFRKLWRTSPEATEASRLAALADAAEAQARIDRAHADSLAERARAQAAEAQAHADADKAQAAAEKRKLRSELELAPLRDAHRKLEAGRAAEERAHEQSRRAHEHDLMRKARAALTGRTFVTAAFVGVNLVAIAGQGRAYGYGWEGWTKAGVLECIALAVGWIGHQALISGRPARGKRCASYALALYMAIVNYAAVADDWWPTPMAAGVALCSLMSPWLWGMYSRHIHADKLDAAGVVPPRAPDFPPLRWVLWFRPTLDAYRWGVREGVSDWRTCVEGWAHEQEQARATAVADAEKVRTLAKAEEETVRMTAMAMRTDAEQERTRALLESVRADLLSAYGHVATADTIADAVLGSPRHPRSIEGLDGDEDPPQDNDDRDREEPDEDDQLPELPALPSAEELARLDDRQKLARARITVYLAREQDIQLQGRGAELARAYDMSPRWGQTRVKEQGTPLFALAGSVVRDDELEDENEDQPGQSGGVAR
ncbi:hypothetical protein ACIBEJ_00930 [Nonomuraea sp. NPDC050790]|uniref:hypothetical protein n=1 Tax=Nonomuraea sp. NPDC050790 TaxID=3364371 RepID=UPI0037B2752A